ncbi:P-loop NTPase [Streptomyces tanashiensis]
MVPGRPPPPRRGRRTDHRTGGTVVTVSGAKGGVGAAVTAVHLALAARASGRSVALVDMDLQSGDIASYLDVQFRRSVADLATIADISARVLQDAVYVHETGLSLLLARRRAGRARRGGHRPRRPPGRQRPARPARGRRPRLRIRLDSANAAVIEMADTALLVTTPDVVAVRAAKRTVRM